MPLTALDPITALIVVDLQKGMIDHAFPHPLSGIVEKRVSWALALGAAAVAALVPIVTSNHRGEC